MELSKVAYLHIKTLIPSTIWSKLFFNKLKEEKLLMDAFL
jgi:hypothetical protein